MNATVRKVTTLGALLLHLVSNFLSFHFFTVFTPPNFTISSLFEP